MEKIKEVLLSKRFKSFYWRLGMMVIASTLDFLAQSLGDFKLPSEVTIVVGLILGELSKHLNNKRLEE